MRPHTHGLGGLVLFIYFFLWANGFPRPRNGVASVFHLRYVRPALVTEFSPAHTHTHTANTHLHRLLVSLASQGAAFTEFFLFCFFLVGRFLTELFLFVSFTSHQNRVTEFFVLFFLPHTHTHTTTLTTTGFYRVLLGFTTFYWVLLGSTAYYRVLLGFTEFYWVLPSFTGFYWVLPGFTEFYRVLPSFTEFYRV